MTDDMSEDSKLRHKDAIRYNQVMAEAAEGLLKELQHPEVRQWVTSIGKQHRYHEARHRRRLNKATGRGQKKDAGEKSEKTIEEQQAEFAAEQEAKA